MSCNFLGNSKHCKLKHVCLLLATCAPTEKLTYVKIVHNGESVFGTAELVLHLQTLSACEWLCSLNLDGADGSFECTAFDYNQRTASCMLSSVLAPHFARYRDRKESVQKIENTQKIGDIVKFTEFKTTDPPEGDQHRSLFRHSGFYQKICVRGKFHYVTPCIA